MSIRVALKHCTRYVYNKPIKVYPQVLRLRPAAHTHTPIISYSLNIEPKNNFTNWQQDPFGNYCARVVFPDLVKEFVIDIDIVADLVAFNPFDFFLEESAQKYPFRYEPQLEKELSPYLQVSENGPLLQELIQAVKNFGEMPTVDFLVAVNKLVNEKVNYIIRLEPGVQSCEETLSKALGSCRDSAWVLVQLFRSVGLAARFVSGYLVQLTPDEKVVDGPNGPDKDFTDLHAWAEVYVPGAGWIGLDATSGLFAAEGHIPLACTPDPISAAPVSGYTAPCEATMEYTNAVTRIDDKPRVTKPYTSQMFQDIRQLGYKVDEILTQHDARLTMGGEPTFVCTEDMESDQWNNTADGPEKRKKSYALLQQLKSSFAPKGLIHLGQGKWYPGEPIPRWQYALIWRKDSNAIWNNPAFLADPNKEGTQNQKILDTFVKNLVDRLGIGENNIHPAYEDYYYYLWEKGNLPANIDLDDIDGSESMARQTLATLDNKDWNTPTGFAIPLAWDYGTETWQSCQWKLKREKLYLIPGNSDMGYRLPLDRLPKNPISTEDTIVAPSPLEDLGELPNYMDLQNWKAPTPKPATKDPNSVIKTTLCAQLKNGHLAIFLPPFESIEPFLLLIAQLENVCEALGVPILIEGYTPPHDNRIEKLVVAPDPGVVEVNIHPSKSWQELLDKYDTLYTSAEKVKLGTQKFMLDGKHTGTMGGNHITLGGVSPAESPLLRRPDLLRSMLNFWVNHPSLSYLFSSPFIGMTSQAPRLDEGKPDAIYNLEIAFKELDKQDHIPFWLVDRLFRNILTDITGNTHRAEFCIDKLYSPDSNTGRLGILELRGFDMPPHRDMLYVQILLVRALVAAFWKRPYRQKLTHWGDSLHDKFMIHHYVKRDMDEVVAYLNNEGIAFKHEWLAPFYDFRFPILGAHQVEDMTLTLRAGIEPWNVLGEEMTNSGTARFVDSSMERVEVKVENFNSDRYQLLCNKVIVPLKATDTPLEFVAGIRYKAWAPPSALHPTIPVDTPLQFDIYDTWNQLSIGGCVYHVMHPGGRNYDTFPVNAFEAEGRRFTRFSEIQHAPQTASKVKEQNISPQEEVRYIAPLTEIEIKLEPIPTQQNNTYPLTLDLTTI